MSFEDFARAFTEERECRYRGSGSAPPELALCRLVTSTHHLGRAVLQGYLDDEGEPPRLDVLAWEQSAGRGRGDRSWVSPPGVGVYASLLRALPAGILQTLPMAIGVALAERVGSWIESRCRLSWPNDLVVDGRKLGGILIDAISRSEASPVAVVSFGIDVGAVESFDGGFSVARTGSEGEGREVSGRREISSLTSEGAEISLAEVAVELLEAVDDALVSPLEATDVAARYRRLSVHSEGDVLRCRLPGSTIEGRFKGFDERGFLRLEIAGRERRIAAGEVMGIA